MEYLYLLRTEPDDTVKELMVHLTDGDLSRVVRLYNGDVDWSKLVDDVMAAEKVVSWW